MIVRKTVRMAKNMDKPILGVVENMSYLYIPEIKKRMQIFGPSKADEMAEMAEAPLLAQMPIDPVMTKLGDDGNIEDYHEEVVESLGQNFLNSLANMEEGEKESSKS
jgi:hypothetical protein